MHHSLQPRELVGVAHDENAEDAPIFVDVEGRGLQQPVGLAGDEARQAGDDAVGDEL